jgi:serine/threonine-protein kinase RsbW
MNIAIRCAASLQALHPWTILSGGQMTTTYCQRLETCRVELVPRDAGAAAWRVDSVHSGADIARVTRAVTDAMAAAGYPEKEIFRVHLALEEAIVNAHKHGHGSDWGTPIAVRYHVGADGVVAQVEDEGPGFDPESVPDPLAPENLERPSGRGLFLMRTYLSGVCHNQRGNCICLCKHRVREQA